MDPNEKTQAMMPAGNPGNPTETKTAGRRRTAKDDNMALKIVASVLGGAAVAGAGGAALYAATRPGDDATDNAGQDNHVDHGSDHGSHHHHHSEVHVHHHNGPTPPPPPPEPEIEFTSLDVVPNANGTASIVGTVTYNDYQITYIDEDMDGRFDVAVCDANRNNKLEGNEIVDVSRENLTVSDFHRGLMADNPLKAQQYQEQIDGLIGGNNRNLIASYGEGDVIIEGMPAEVVDVDDDDIIVGMSEPDVDIDGNIINIDEPITAQISTYDGIDADGNISIINEEPIEVNPENENEILIASHDLPADGDDAIHVINDGMAAADVIIDGGQDVVAEATDVHVEAEPQVVAQAEPASEPEPAMDDIDPAVHTDDQWLASTDDHHSHADVDAAADFDAIG